MNEPRPAVVSDAATVAPTARRCPTVASQPDERDDLPNQPRRSQQPDGDVSFFVATLEIGMLECARPVKVARTFEAVGSRGERADVANDPDANRSDVFVLRPYNGLRLTRGGRPSCGISLSVTPPPTGPAAG